MTSDRDDRIETIRDDQSKALRAPKTTEKAKGLTGDPRTAVRYLGTDDVGEETFQVVTTRTESFPEGVDNVTTCGIKQAAHWVDANDPDVIDVDEEDGFEVKDGMNGADGGEMPA